MCHIHTQSTFHFIADIHWLSLDQILRIDFDCARQLQIPLLRPHSLCLTLGLIRRVFSYATRLSCSNRNIFHFVLRNFWLVFAEKINKMPKAGPYYLYMLDFKKEKEEELGRTVSMVSTWLHHILKSHVWRRTYVWWRMTRHFELRILIDFFSFC